MKFYNKLVFFAVFVAVVAHRRRLCSLMSLSQLSPAEYISF